MVVRAKRSLFCVLTAGVTVEVVLIVDVGAVIVIVPVVHAMVLVACGMAVVEVTIAVEVLAAHPGQCTMASQTRHLLITVPVVSVPVTVVSV